MESGRTPPPPSGTPPSPSAPPAPAGPPVQRTRGEGTAGRRIAAVVVALVFAFAGAVMIIASLDLSDGPLCDDVAAGTAVPEDGECFDVSSTMQTVKTVLTFASGIAAALVFLAGLFYAFTARAGRVIVIAAAAAIVLGALGILI